MYLRFCSAAVSRPTLWLAIYPGQLWLRPDHVLRHLAGTSLLIVSLPDWRDGVLPLLQPWRLFLMFSTLIPRAFDNGRC